MNAPNRIRELREAAVPDADEAPPTRLRQARINAGYVSATSAAAYFGWTESGYRHHENGTRRFGLECARIYANAFGVDEAHLLEVEIATSRDTLDLSRLAPSERLPLLTLFNALIERRS